MVDNGYHGGKWTDQEEVVLEAAYMALNSHEYVEYFRTIYPHRTPDAVIQRGVFKELRQKKEDELERKNNLLDFMKPVSGAVTLFELNLKLERILRELSLIKDMI